MIRGAPSLDTGRWLLVLGALTIWSGPLGARPEAGPSAGGWRRCEVDGPLTCRKSGEVCDMFRNRCVPACQGSQCCEEVVCPAGSICGAVAGRCAAPAGLGCFDLGTTWWTGRDLPPGRAHAPREPTPRSIEIHNEGPTALYFDATWQRAPRFDVLQWVQGDARPLDLPENQFCPCPCPAEGAPHCRDCGRPRPSALRLSAGKSIRVEWSGWEQPSARRVCAALPGETCLVSHAPLPGHYTLEVCAHTAVQGGQPDASERERLRDARMAGERRCRRVEFAHPARSALIVRFER